MTRRLTLSAFTLALSLAASVESPAKDLPAVAYEQFATGFVSPLIMIPYREGDQAFLVVDQAGTIHFLGEKGGKPGKAFLDLRKGIVKLKKGFDERGALGVALHPKFASNKKVYVFYSHPLAKDGKDGYDHTGRLSEFKVKKDGVADSRSERVLFTIDEPQWNHDGGNLVFGKDGYLYLGLGDGGGANDLVAKPPGGHEKGGNGQSTKRFLGKILRIDVDNGTPYGIPDGNPFKGTDGLDEIYAWGIRNPWGITVDHGGNGDLIIADVGQGRFEEVNVITPGNYGWPRYEGYVSFDQKNPGAAATLKVTPAAEGFKAPVLAYPHTKAFGTAPGYGISITGGHVYRGKALPGLTGVYIFADWTMSWAGSRHGLYAGVRDTPETWTMQILPGAKGPEGPHQNVIGFGQDHEGELYVLTNTGKGPSGKNGAIWKIVPAK